MLVFRIFFLVWKEARGGMAKAAALAREKTDMPGVKKFTAAWLNSAHVWGAHTWWLDSA